MPLSAPFPAPSPAIKSVVAGIVAPPPPPGLGVMGIRSKRQWLESRQRSCRAPLGKCPLEPKVEAGSTLPWLLRPTSDR